MKRMYLLLLVVVVFAVFVTSIAVGKDNDQGLKHRVEKLEHTVAEQQETITELYELILSAQNCCTATNDAIDNLDVRLINAEADIGDLKTTDETLTNTIDDHTADIGSIQGQVNSQGLDIANLTGDIATLTGRVTTIEPKIGKIGPPDYDSGWITREYQVVLQHNLGGNPENYLVDLTSKDPDFWKIHGGYGISRNGTNDGWWGAFWIHLSETRLSVLCPGILDPSGFEMFDEIRIRIWVIE